MQPISTIEFTKVEKKKNQYNIVNLHSNNNRIYLNLPIFSSPFGITKYTNNGQEKYSLNITITEDTPEIYNFLENLDDLITDNFLENKQWLDILEKDISSTRKDIEVCGNKLINKQEKYPSYLNLKLIYNDKGEFYSNIVKCDSKGQYTQIRTIEDIKPLLYNKINISANLVILNVWIMKNKYGITLKPKKIVLLVD